MNYKTVFTVVLMTILSCKEDKPVLNKNIVIVEDRKQFAFVIVKYKQPHLKYIPAVMVNDFTMGGYKEIAPEISSTLWVETALFSEIQEFDNYTEDDKYRMMDMFERGLLNEVDFNYRQDVRQNVENENLREVYLQNKSEIQDIDVRAYPSYKEASESRRVLKLLWDKSVADVLSGKVKSHYSN